MHHMEQMTGVGTANDDAIYDQNVTRDWSDVIMRHIKSAVSMISHYVRVFIHKHRVLWWRLALTLVFYSIGAAYYHATMGWSVLDSFYFISVSLAMVGFGDMTPNSEGTRLFTTFYMIVGIPLVFAMLSEYFSDVMHNAETKALKRFGTKALHSYNRHIIKFILTIVAMFASFLIGALFMYNVEDNWTFLQSFYWAVVASFTIGYGDFYPTKEISKVFCVFYLIVSAIIIALAVANFNIIRADVRAQRKHIYMLSRRLDMHLLREMSAAKGGSGGVSEMDFLVFMLVQTKGLDMKRDIEPLRRRFKELDRYNSGLLTEKDIIFFEEAESRRKKRALDRLKGIFTTWRRAPEYLEQAWEVTKNPLSALAAVDDNDEDGEGDASPRAYNMTGGDSPVAASSSKNAFASFQAQPQQQGAVEGEGHPRTATDADALLEMAELYVAGASDEDNDDDGVGNTATSSSDKFYRYSEAVAP